MTKKGHIPVLNCRSVWITLFFISILTSSVLYCLEEAAPEKDNEREVSRYSIEEFHHQFAAGLNNLVWNILVKEDKTRQERELMIHAAHASRYHWGMIGTPIELQRGEWLLSRVYGVLKRPEPALYHAEICLVLTEENDLDDFDLAYAYEAMARANAATGNEEEFRKYSILAREAGNLIRKEEDKTLFFEDFNTEPWYGMR